MLGVVPVFSQALLATIVCRSSNMITGDVVVLREDGMVPTRQPLARITKTHPGRDDVVQVVIVKTGSNTYTHPVHKVILLLPQDS